MTAFFIDFLLACTYMSLLPSVSTAKGFLLTIQSIYIFKFAGEFLFTLMYYQNWEHLNHLH